MSRPVPEINTTPLIDVLLVLLVLLVITLPHSTHRVSLELPVGHAPHTPSPITSVEVDFDGEVFWNGTPVDDQHLSQRFTEASTTPDIVRIEPDRHVRYERVAQILASAQRAHVIHLSVTPIAN